MKNLIAFIVLVPMIVLAQAPDIGWEKNFGGPGVDAGTCIQATSDGGYIIAGSTTMTGGNVSEAFGYDDFWVVKTDGQGNLQWEKSYGGEGNEVAFAILETDGGYILAGHTFSYDNDVTNNHGEGDAWVIKIGVDGTLLWQKAIGGGNYDNALSIAEVAEGGYIICGTSLSMDGDIGNNYGAEDMLLVRLDVTGVILWQKNFGGSGVDTAYSVVQMYDGGYLIAGHTQSLDGDVIGLHTVEEVVTMGDYWIVKTDIDGNLQWQKCLGGYGTEYAFDICVLSDTEYIITGQASSNDGDVSGLHGSFDYWVTKIDDAGSLLWQKCLGGAGYEESRTVCQAPDGGLLILGTSVSTEGDVSGPLGSSDYWLTKLSGSGSLEWEKSFGGSDGDYGFGAIAVGDEVITLIGYSNSDDIDVGGNNGDSDFWIVQLGDTPVQEVTIAIDTVSSEEFCAGDPIGVEVTASGTYPEDNVFVFQLSDGEGSFENPITIDEEEAIVVYTMTGTIPDDIAQGTGYRVRVISSNATEEPDGTANGTDLIINNPPAPQGAAAQELSEDDAALSSLDSTGEDIAWYSNEADALTGTDPLPSSTIAVSGTTYYATQTIDGCEGFPLAVTVTVTLATGSFTANVFNLYPNPVMEELHIRASHPITGVAIYNLPGQKIMKKDLNAEDAVIDVSLLAPGAYLVKISAEGSEVTRRIIKQ